MWVTVDKLIAERIYHLAHIKFSRFLAKTRIKDNVQQKVAQLLCNIVQVSLKNCIGELKGLLYGLRAKRSKGLLSVPRTLLPQLVHYSQQAVELRYCIGILNIIISFNLFHHYIIFETKIGKNGCSKRNN